MIENYNNSFSLAQLSKILIKIISFGIICIQMQKQQKTHGTNPIQMNFTTDNMPVVIANKIKGLVATMNKDVIDMKKLRTYLAEGIPDEAALVRQYCWKIILGYLPQQKSKWQTKVQKQQKIYDEFIKMFLPSQKFIDYPILLNKNQPNFKDFEQDFILWQQIQKDTSRTHAELSFFCMPAPEILIPFLTSPRRQKFRMIYGEDQSAYKNFMTDKQTQRKTYRYDYMTRILFIYAKLNPKIQYVQGMNEILAPIFYIVNAMTKPNQQVQEASCFFMFNNAISQVIQMHIKDLDKSQSGIHGKLNKVNQMLVVIQPRVWSRLQQLKIDPFFYCFRWMTLLFAQDFPLFDTVRIWQSIFSADNKIQFMNFFAIAMIISAKSFILNNSFTSVLEHLQNICEFIKIHETIKLANQLYYQFKDHDFKQHSILTKQALAKPPKPKKTWMDNFLNKII